MVEKDDRSLTVLVLGEPGQPTRRYRVHRGAIVLLAVALPSAALGIGYVLGHRKAAHSSVATIAAPARSAAEAAVAPVPAEPPPEAFAPSAVEPAAVEAAIPAAEPRALAQAVMVAPAPAAQAPPSGAPFQISRDGQSQVLELHLFAVDGSPRASDFTQLEALMACGGGQSEVPDVALVRVMVEAQQNFGKPVVLISGRCAGHGDHPDAAIYHRSGRAADFRVRGVTSEQLTNWLVKRGVPAVGRYLRGGYVHVDVRTGPHEQWQTGTAAADKPAASKEAANEAAPSAPPSEPEPAAPAEPQADPAPAL